MEFLTIFWKKSLKVAQQLLSFIADFYTCRAVTNVLLDFWPNQPSGFKKMCIKKCCLFVFPGSLSSLRQCRKISGIAKNLKLQRPQTPGCFELAPSATSSPLVSIASLAFQYLSIPVTCPSLSPQLRGEGKTIDFTNMKY